MLSHDNYTAEYILKLREDTGADPSMLERTVFAFGLLEAIRSVGMPFIFKGGTSLLVMLKEPRRLSTDAGIVKSRKEGTFVYYHLDPDDNQITLLSSLVERMTKIMTQLPDRSEL